MGDGATSPMQTARSAPEPLMPVPRRHLAGNARECSAALVSRPACASAAEARGCGPEASRAWLCLSREFSFIKPSLVHDFFALLHKHSPDFRWGFAVMECCLPPRAWEG